jgi:hypothetical protein
MMEDEKKEDTSGSEKKHLSTSFQLRVVLEYVRLRVCGTHIQMEMTIKMYIEAGSDVDELQHTSKFPIL